METKVCKDCGRELPLDQFVKNPHGYTSYCKECFNKRRMQGISAAKNRQLDKTPTVQPPKGVSPTDLSHVSDAEIVEELRNRGFNGTLTKVTTLDI